MSGGWRRSAARSAWLVSPVRRPTEIWRSHWMPGKRRPQVLLDVVVERPKRRDVEHLRARRRLPGQAVDGGQEGGQRLAGAGRRQEQRVLAAGDRRPALMLGRGRLGERALEPAGHRRRKQALGLGGLGAHAHRTVKPSPYCLDHARRGTWKRRRLADPPAWLRLRAVHVRRSPRPPAALIDPGRGPRPGRRRAGLLRPAAARRGGAGGGGDHARPPRPRARPARPGQAAADPAAHHQGRRARRPKALSPPRLPDPAHDAGRAHRSRRGAGVPAVRRRAWLDADARAALRPGQRKPRLRPRHGRRCRRPSWCGGRTSW